MLNKLPDWIDPVSSAQHDKHFVARVNQSLFKRLSEVVLETSHDVDVDIRFYFHRKLKVPAFELKVKTVVVLQCQRSLKSFEWPVDASASGVFVETLSQLDEMPEDVEVYELIDEKVSLRELVEEEILLNVPMVPIDASAEMEYRNDEADLELNLNGSEAEMPTEDINPFAALKALQKKD